MKGKMFSVLAIVCLMVIMAIGVSAYDFSGFANNISINCQNITEGTPIALNGSAGFSLNQSTQIVWAKCEPDLWLYWNDNTDYAVGTSTEQRPMDVEVGDTASVNASDVWDAYRLVWHMNDGNTTIMDSTANGNDGTTTNDVSLTDADSVFGDGQYCAGGVQGGGSNPFMLSGQILTPSEYPRSVEFWFKLNNSDQTLQGLGGLQHYDLSDGTEPIFLFTYAGSWYFDSVSIPSQDTDLHHLLMVYDGVSVRVFLDGQYKNEALSEPTASENLSFFLCGKSIAEWGVSGGTFDESRVFAGNLTEEYANQIYQNKLGTEGFGTLGAPACVPNWVCSGYGVCLENSTKNCNATTDLNECGEEYTGDFSEFEPVFCSYNFTYQESADAWSAEIMGGTGFFLVNYTKPVGANLNSLWQLKHGDLATYNATIPLECWNADNITLMFRIESGHQGYSYQPCWSYPTCWNGTEWESLGVDSTTTDGFGGGCGSSAEFLMEDGNWSTNALFLNLWYGNDCSAGDGWKIYEEAMWWNMTEIPCEPLWNCSVFDDCIGGTKECLNVSDLNECGVPFEGLLSDFDEECEEETPTGYVAQFGTGDLPKLTIDVLGKGLLELIGLVGLVAVIVIAVGGASRLKKAVRK